VNGRDAGRSGTTERESGMTGSAGAAGGERDEFEEAYLAGVVAAAAPAEGVAAGPATRAAPSEAVALHGCVLAPDGPIDDGYVVVGLDGRIAAVQAQQPQGVRVQQTGGVILPGLIDLHGHPEFNVFAAWEPPRLFTNRYQWRASELYQALVRDPQNRLLEALPAGTQLRYAEVRALAGGVTAIQGGSGRTRSAEEALVRNVDLRIFGEHKARSMIDLPSATSRDAERLRQILADIGDRKVTAFYLHLAEGRADDQRSQREFDRLLEFQALTPATVLVHGTALTRDQLGQVADAGAKLVWSPQSNLRLYGETTQAADALAAGVPVGLGADWLPSGSTSLLAELKVAARVLATQGHQPDPRQMVAMVTSTAARIAGLDDHLGALERGRPADILVLERHHDDPFDNVLAADPSWVELVMVDGDLSYGRADWLAGLAEDASRLEPLVAWGKPMLVDNSYRVRPGGEPPPTLAQLRADLIAQYPQVGPIFA
jgi:5-methylthioadenosine/S-adenosylhomocysteine deaminase